MSRTDTTALPLLVLLALGASVGLCMNRPLRAAQDPPLFTSESSLVVLHVTVRDKQGRYVSGLAHDAFDVFEDGKRQITPLFADEDAPVTLGLVVDTSGSMHGNRDLVLAAAEAFVERSNPRDEIFGLTFNENVKAALPSDMPFTSDPGVLRRAMAAALTTQGRTALYDALDDGISYLSAGQFERKALVVISDGGDNASETSFDQIRARLQASNVVVHAVSLVDPVEPDSNPKRLRQLAEGSGGVTFAPHDARAVRNALEQVALEIRSAYTIGYTPVDVDAAPGFRRLRVGVRAPQARSVVVRTRAGYMAGPRPGTKHEP
jgi:Ca-activated chloride channel family protein